MGYTGTVVSVEVDIRPGIPGVEIIGLPSSEIRESRERIRVAIKNSGFDFPVRRIVVNLAPAGMRKCGVAFDLAISVAILQVSAQLSVPDEKGLLVLGELCLDGNVRPVPAVIAALSTALESGINTVLLPKENASEARSLPGIYCGAISFLSDLRNVSLTYCYGKENPKSTDFSSTAVTPDFADVVGQKKACRVMQIAAAGRHNALLTGPPGIGKSMLCFRFPSLFSKLTLKEAREVTRIYSLIDRKAGSEGLLRNRAFRSPHHSATLQGMVGGGKTVLPGEVSLAHHGVLFLDEATEFRGRILQSLREPLEYHRISIVRAGHVYTYPADFQLLATANLCPCGNYGSRRAICLCSQQDVFRYWRKIGAALLDRIELRLSMQDDDPGMDLMGKEGMERIRQSVMRAISIQQERYKKEEFTWNSRIPQSVLEHYCPTDSKGKSFLQDYYQSAKGSMRSCSSILRISRTIADLEQRKDINGGDVQEAIFFRGKVDMV